MIQIRRSLVGFIVFAAGLSVGCSAEVPAPVTTDSSDLALATFTETVVLTVEGMT
jgi:hypothetical protein